MGRTSKDAASTVNAVHDVMFLQFLPHFQFRHAAEEIGFKSHRACLNTFATTDTVFFFGSNTLILRQEEEAR
jgi:hypothetical protein